MLSAGAYSFRQKARLAVSLSWIGGYTNVITLIFCGATTSHVTGNVTRLGESIADGGASTAVYFAFLLISFVSGAALAGFMLELARWHHLRSRYALPLALEALLLTVFSFAIHSHLAINRPEDLSTFTLYWMTGISAMAMGLQNATITKISGAVVRTTHLTGVSTDFGLEGAQLLLWLRERTRARRGVDRGQRTGRALLISRRHPSAQRLFILAAVFWSFLFGGVAGAVVEKHALWIAIVPPIFFLCFIVIHEFVAPIAEVEELNLLGDPELKGFGLDRAMLPPELGIYRLAYPPGRLHRQRTVAPNFLSWVERLPRRWRVIILAIGPQTRFDANAFLDLQTAVDRLQQARRRLIICGLSPAQYRSLHDLGVTRLLDIDDFCPDLEFAVARGMELVRELTHAADVPDN